MRPAPTSTTTRPDAHRLEKQFRDAELRDLTLHTQRLLRESMKLLATHDCASSEMAHAVEQARAQVEAARVVLRRTAKHGG